MNRGDLPRPDQLIHQAPADPETVGTFFDGEQQSVVRPGDQVDDAVRVVLMGTHRAAVDGGPVESPGREGTGM